MLFYRRENFSGLFFNFSFFDKGSGSPAYESAFCAMLDKNVPTGLPIYELSSLLFFLVPMMIIIILYVLIGLRIRQSSRHSLGKQMHGGVHGETKQIQSKKSIVRMLGKCINDSIVHYSCNQFYFIYYFFFVSITRFNYS